MLIVGKFKKLVQLILLFYWHRMWNFIIYYFIRSDSQLFDKMTPCVYHLGIAHILRNDQVKVTTLINPIEFLKKRGGAGDQKLIIFALRNI